MSGTELENLKFGDLIFTDIIIDPRDLAYLNSQSATSRKIREGEPVRRICIVLETGSNSIAVTYVATFHGSTRLPPTLDPKLWYPFNPAEFKYFRPLPPLNGKAQWASLRTKIIITQQEVRKLDGTVRPDSAKIIYENMH